VIFLLCRPDSCLKCESGGIAAVGVASGCHILQGHGAGNTGAESGGSGTGTGEDVVEGYENAVRSIGGCANHFVQPQGHYVLGSGTEDNSALATAIVRQCKFTIGSSLDPQQSTGTYAGSHPSLHRLPIPVVDTLEHGRHVYILEGGTHLVSKEIVTRWGQMSTIDDHISFVGNVPLGIAKNGTESAENAAGQETLDIGLAEQTIPGEIGTRTLGDCMG